MKTIQLVVEVLIGMAAVVMILYFVSHSLHPIAYYASNTTTGLIISFGIKKINLN